MAQERAAAQERAVTASMSDGLFWGLMCALMAGALGSGIAFAVGEISSAGWIAGGALGGLVFVVATYLLARSATSANLPPPNTLQAPVAPQGGAFQAPTGGAFRAPGAPIMREAAPSAFTPAPAESLADMGRAAGEAVGAGEMGKSAGEAVDKAAHSASEMGKAAGDAVSKAAYSASAAVTSAAQAARDAISGVVGSGDPAPATSVEPGDAVKPAALDAPREGGADDLKRIKGVGPKLEELLHSLGFYHFDQIAAWGPSEVAWVDSNLEGFNGRATRDEWVAQAKLLAAGSETEFSRRVDKGEVY